MSKITLLFAGDTREALTLIDAILEGHPLYGNTHCHKIFLMQKRAIRKISNVLLNVYVLFQYMYIFILFVKFIRI